MNIVTVTTSPFPDQRPGTAGLRKKVAVFQQAHYLENFVQSIFDTAQLPAGATLVLGGDGRYHNREAVQTIIRMAAANGAGHIIVGRDGLLSTPAVSNLVRERGADGGFILTASHNPGGPHGDFGLKFNTSTGGQAPAGLTDSIFERTRRIDRFLTVETPPLDLDRAGTVALGPLRVDIIDPVTDYAACMERLFDFDAMRALASRLDFRIRYDALNAITGPYAREILERRLGAAPGSVAHAEPLPDFGGMHPDPNPVDAAELVEFMRQPDGPDFGAASDGDGDRNMIVGPGLVVSPGDSLAILAANAHLVPGYAEGLNGVARSMPTSRAVDRVATELGIPCYETPTGWRYFCNLLEDGRITLCGEESFGTGSSHIREKDGLWAVLFWLNLLATTGKSLTEIVYHHWRKYGRDYFCRHDYFIEDPQRAADLMDGLANRIGQFPGRCYGQLTVGTADSFSYEDPVDGSIAENQGYRIHFTDGSRIVYRLSGTGTGGATLRKYFDRHTADPERLQLDRHGFMTEMAAASRRLAQVAEITGLHQPTAVI